LRILVVSQVFKRQAAPMNLNIQVTRFWPALATGALLVSTLFGTAVASAQSEVTPPSVPEAIQVPVGNTLFLAGHAIGSQNYVCSPSDGGYKFVLFTPQATLYTDDNQQLTTHFYSPNPVEDGTVRATWQDSRDTSRVWGQAIQSSTDPSFVAPDSIPWVLLRRTGAQPGPAGDGGLGLPSATFIQRLNTSGGVAPASGCNSPEDVGRQVFVPYSADYLFYTDA
jgi:hypothetical protein